MAASARGTTKGARAGRPPAERSAWLADFTRSLTSTTRTAHSMRLYTEMARRADLDIRPYLFNVLTRIAELQPVRVSTVADETDYDRSTVSRQVADLVKLGCVERLQDDTDGRAVVLRLTERGEDAVSKVFEAWMSFLDEITGDWKPTERDRFLKLLQRFGSDLAARVGTV